ncbi:hypothetical protein QAD02_010746 [Eretmocerus hayati]|uniref:Uncharacterized protein n=1 Tax=Eretmocerus hayati TaxID=131215 RepID=A0ACC2NUU5_9HYME|nr:hypothetical protein QAD02_010746 [Eretmocerus hayati]
MYELQDRLGMLHFVEPLRPLSQPEPILPPPAFTLTPPVSGHMTHPAAQLLLEYLRASDYDNYNSGSDDLYGQYSLPPPPVACCFSPADYASRSLSEQSYDCSSASGLLKQMFCIPMK